MTDFMFLVIFGTLIKDTSTAVPTSVTDSECFDKRDCSEYDIHTACCGEYEAFSRDNCAKYCGFCTPKVPDPRLCVDTIDWCTELNGDLCTNHLYEKYANEHCAGFCKVCERPLFIPKCPNVTIHDATTPTPTLDPDCFDKRDCSDYDIHTACCGRYEAFARSNCPKHCGFCTPKVTEAPVCVDKLLDCHAYNSDLCTNRLYQKFAHVNCAGFCKICEQPVFIPDCVGDNQAPSRILG